MDDTQIEKEKSLIVSILFWFGAIFFFLPGFWLSYPLLKSGVLKPKTGDKRTLAEIFNFVVLTFFGVILFWVAVAIIIAFIL